MSKNDTDPPLVPRLRFPEFTEKWRPAIVDELFEAEDQSEKATRFESDKILTVKLHANGVVKNERTGAMTGGANYFKRRAGQFIFSKIDLLNGAFGIVPEDLDGFYSSSDVPAFSFGKNHSPTFFLNWLTANYRRLVVERTGTSATLKRVSPEKFRALPIPLPSPAEQQKIAHCLGSLDDLIGAEGRKLEVLREYKQGLMQQLFPREGETQPRLRFPEFREAREWDEQPLEEIAEFQSGGTPSKGNPAFWNGSIPWVSAKDMKQLILDGTEHYITNAAVDDGAKLVPAGTVLVLTRGMTLLKDVPICLLARPMSFNQDVRALRPKNGFNGRFLAYMLVGNKPRIRSMVDISGHGTGRLNTDRMKALELLFPPPAEQQRIADCLSALDDRIAAQAEKLEALRSHKRGLLQQLFPSPEDAEA